VNSKTEIQQLTLDLQT